MEIAEKQKERIKEIAETHKFKLVLLFGSRARGRTHQQSDVDIGFLSDRSTGLSEIARVEFEMSQQLHIPRLELVSLGGMSSLFLREVITDGHVLYESSAGEYTAFISYVFKRFVEERPLRTLRRQSLRAFSTTV